MTLRTPPSWEQNASHPAENDRLTTQALWSSTGIIKDTSLAVTANSPTGMSVRVASGWAAIVGTTQANMGTYVAYNDATVTLTITAADATNPRIDLICATINDSYYSGVTDNVVFQVIAGTPAGSPVAPTLPDNSISLATVAVAANASVIVSGNITDTRVLAGTNVASGDITEIVAGTGISITSATGPIPTVAIDTAVTADLTTAQTLTNKTLTAPVITQGTSTPTFATNAYTLVAGDAGKLLLASNGGTAATLYIPTDASVNFAIGTQISILQTGSGKITVTATTPGTTNIYSTGATSTSPACRVQYSAMVATKVSANTWYIIGDIS